MKRLLIFDRKRFLQTLVVATAIIFLAGIIYSEYNNISVFTTNDTPKAIYNVQTNKKQVALTFNLSLGDNNIKKILSMLEKYSLNGKATFFLSPKWSKENEELVKHLFNSGYGIGNHCCPNVDYSKLSDEELNSKILKSHDVLKKITGEVPIFFRTFNGYFDERVLNTAHNLGYTVIQWDTDSNDRLNPGINKIASQVIENVHPGDIILMHADDSSTQIADALPLIISTLKKNGYEFLTIDQLLSDSKIKLSEIN